MSPLKKCATILLKGTKITHFLGVHSICFIGNNLNERLVASKNMNKKLG